MGRWRRCWWAPRDVPTCLRAYAGHSRNRLDPVSSATPSLVAEALAQCSDLSLNETKLPWDHVRPPAGAADWGRDGVSVHEAWTAPPDRQTARPVTAPPGPLPASRNAYAAGHCGRGVDASSGSPLAGGQRPRRADEPALNDARVRVALRAGPQRQRPGLANHRRRPRVVAAVRRCRLPLSAAGAPVS